jgi:DNA adenine methylase
MRGSSAARCGGRHEARLRHPACSGSVGLLYQVRAGVLHDWHTPNDLHRVYEAEGVLKAPFPWFGGKRKVATEVWRRFGKVANYVEPFFGSGAVLLGRPDPIEGNETVNDLDGYVANFWRALQQQPTVVAEWADNPVNENDLHARHVWLLERRDTLRPQLEGDPSWCDPQIAGWWAWGMACWIGSGFCSGNGPWWIDENRQLVHLGNNGQGVNRQRVHLGNNGQGVNRQRVHLGDNGRGRLDDWFIELAARLRFVRVCSGDWSRVCGPSVTFKHGVTAVFLDPPYADTAGRQSDLYREDCEQVAHAVRKWAIANGENPLMRIALCGYEGEHVMPESWSVYEWSAGDGFGGQAKERTENGDRERIWFSPHCKPVAQADLFAQESA